MAANTKYSVNKKFIQPFVPYCDRKMTRALLTRGHSFAMARNAPSPASFSFEKDQPRYFLDLSPPQPPQ
jgi:hypothetical protein